MNITITHIDTACVLININGFKILTDPTLDKKDVFFPKYLSSPLAFSKKYNDPALSVNGEEAIETTKLLNPNIVIPIHYEGWWHFKQSVNSLKNEIKESGLNDKFLWLNSGVETQLTKYKRPAIQITEI